MEEVKDPFDTCEEEIQVKLLKLEENGSGSHLDKSFPSGLVITIRNISNQTEFLLSVSSFDLKIGRLKREIKKITKIPKRAQRLLYLGKVLDFNNLSLKDYHISKFDTIQLFPLPKHRKFSHSHSKSSLHSPSSLMKVCTKCKQNFKLLDNDLNGLNKNVFDYELDEHIIDNKFWCFLLLLASLLNLTSDISFYFFEGRELIPCAKMNFDCFMIIYNSLCNIFGFYLAIKGLSILRKINSRN